MVGDEHYWDEDSYLRIEHARYDAGAQALEVTFRDGDVVQVSAWRLLRPDQRDPQWESLSVVDNYWVHVPAVPLDVDLPGATIRSITDPIFAAHLARKAEESAQRVGTRLQALRKARGFTTQQVAERVGMPQQSISRIEQGRHAVSFPTLEKILVAMGCSLDDLHAEQPGT
jgi:DNA-binding XRE family transcriptional regulator